MYFLTPSKYVNNVINYSLGYCLAKHPGITLVGIIVMTNHIHIINYDEDGSNSLFMRDFDRMVAKALNVHLKRVENFWSSEQYNRVTLMERQDVIRKMSYLGMNCVKAGLVRHPYQWPGVFLMPREKNRVVKAVRPKKYFSKKGGLPSKVSFSVGVPPIFGEGEYGVQRFVEDFNTYFEEEHSKYLQEHPDKEFMGRKRLMEINPWESPSGTRENFRKLNPRFSGSNPKVLKAQIKEYKRFNAAYRIAYENWRNGMRDVIFPPGTDQMVRHHGVKTGEESFAALGFSD